MDGWVVSQIKSYRRSKRLLPYDTILGGTPPFQFLITPVSHYCRNDEASVARRVG